MKLGAIVTLKFAPIEWGPDRKGRVVSKTRDSIQVHLNGSKQTIWVAKSGVSQ